MEGGEGDPGQPLPPFACFPFSTDEDIMNEFTHIDESLVCTYSQAGTVPLAVVDDTIQLEDASRIITRICDSPTPDDYLEHNLGLEADSNMDISARPDSGQGFIEGDSSLDILPPSPPAQRAPSAIRQPSAFAQTADDSPILSSLRTLRNIELSEASSSTPATSASESSSDKSSQSATDNTKDGAKDAKENPVPSKAMRQIHFESDNSNQSFGQSPSSFISEPEKAVEGGSIAKPIVNRPLVELRKDSDQAAALAALPEQSSASPANTCEADSATQEFIPQLRLLQRTTPPIKESPVDNKEGQDSQPEQFPDSQAILSFTPTPTNGDSQTTTPIARCLETQDLIRCGASVSGAGVSAADSPALSDSGADSLALCLNSQTQRMSHDMEHTSTPNLALGSTPVLLAAASQMRRTVNDTFDTISSSEVSTQDRPDECVTFEAVIRFYNPLNSTWTTRTTVKDLPLNKLDALTSGSASEYLPLLEDMDCETRSGSRLDLISDAVRHNASSAYHGDVSRMDSTSAASSVLSRMSVFEAGHMTTSSVVSSRRSMGETSATSASSTPGTAEFAVPKRPVRQKRRSDSAERRRSAEQTEQAAKLIEPEQLTPPCAQQIVTETPETPPEPTLPADEDSGALTELKVARKRGRKPKSLPEEPETPAATATPIKKGRRGRPPRSAEPPESSSAAPAPRRGRPPSSATKKAPAAADEVIAKDDPPSPVESESPELPTASQVERVLEAKMEWRESKTRSYEVGMPVFAQWTDKCYYAATITHRDPVHAGKWSVAFDDGQVRNLVEEFILPIRVLEKKQSILVLNECLGEGRPGIVVGYDNKSGELQYVVEMDNGGALQVVRKRICMTQDQVRMYHDSLVVPQLFSPQSFKLSLDNIVTGKRRRMLSTVPESTVTSPRNSPRTKSSVPQSPLRPATSSSVPTTPTRAAPPTNVRRRGKKDVLLDSSTESSGSILLSQEQERRRSSTLAVIDVNQLDQSEAEEETDVDDEPQETRSIPMPKDSIFEGFTFILTKTTKPVDVSSYENDYEADVLEGYNEQLPYVKEKIRKQLVAGGGRVLEHFDYLYLENTSNLLVVCNRPCRTERYIRSLAARVRAVSHNWVYQCCLVNKLLPPGSFSLPCGIDLQGNIIEWSQTTGHCLTDTRFLVAGPASFIALWQPILVQAGSQIAFSLHSTDDPETSKRNGYREEAPVNYIIATKDCQQVLVDQATRMKIPIVSSEWVIQSLICGRRLDVKSRPEFHYGYKA